ncbi:MAG: protein kinase [Acidobacteria bacterium]|nr:protein kinase [Acidobacteriota bacterium]
MSSEERTDGNSPALGDPRIEGIVARFHARTRYRIEAVLGEGGMGIVFKAADPELKRSVALKVIKEGSAEQTLRFIREAQAQARIAHDSICKVYEVGEVEGYRFIAMQYIAGWTLCDARDRLTLEQKIAVMQRVADALHEAHRLGLIHRDIKPGNIMVEQIEGGAWRPYLLDFGVLRDMEGPTVTRTGITVGTPQYMAPEQILGQVHKLDRRTDVYGLGATFYELLSGRPPFQGETSTDLLLKALNDDPAQLRRIEPSTPPDIDHIIMKCIEKEPQRRYESARALSEDLGRYVGGDPVLARGTTTWRYRTVKKIRKHKLVAIPVAAALIIIIAMLALGVRMQFQARKRELLARQLGQNLEGIASIMRGAYMMPPHDIRAEKRIVRERIGGIEEAMKAAGRSGAGVGNFAMGRAYRFLEENERARGYLQAAWDSGYREPEVAYELGLVMGHLYQQELEDVRGITDRVVRDRRLQESQNRFRAPAIEFLRMGKQASSLPIEYGEALISYYERRYDEAIGKAQAAASGDLWRYEEYQLEGRILQSRATEEGQQGRLDAASQSYEQAERAYKSALEIVRSHPGLYVDICSLHWNRLNTLSTGRRGGDAPFEEARRWAEAGTRIDPDNAGIHQLAANIHWLWGDDRLARGQDPVPQLEKAVEMAERVIELEPGRASAYESLGDTYEIWGAYKSFTGHPAGELMEKSIRNYQKAIRVRPTESVYMSLGSACSDYSGDAFEGWLADPTDFFRLGIDSEKKAHEINQKWGTPVNGLAKLYRLAARYEHLCGRDPRTLIHDAIEAAAATVTDGQDSVGYYQIAVASRVETEYCLATGRATEVPYRTACENFEKALALAPDELFSHTELARTHVIRAAALLERGQDPGGVIREATRLLDRAVVLNPRYADAYFLMSESQQAIAAYDLQRGLAPSASLKRAIEASRKGLEINRQGAPGRITSATAWLLQARAAIVQDRPIEKALAEARSLLEPECASPPMNSLFRLKMGESFVIEGMSLVRAGRSPEAAFTKAAEFLNKALEPNPNDAQIYGQQAMMALQRAEYDHRAHAERGPSDLVLQGLAACEKALGIHPDYPEVLAVRGALYNLRAESADTLDERREATRKARESLDRAATLNRNLGRLYRWSYLKISAP